MPANALMVLMEKAACFIHDHDAYFPIWPGSDGAYLRILRTT
jgi:hypothetical protein